MSRRLLCIGLGVDKYEDPRLSELHFAEADIGRFFAALPTRASAPVLVKALPAGTNSVQAMSEIREFLRDNGVRHGDRVLFCFAGHGALVTDDAQFERQYLLLHKADTGSLQDGHVAGNDVLAVHSLLALFDQFYAQFALLIDACRLPPRAPDSSHPGHTRESIRIGLVGRAIPSLRPAAPRGYRHGNPELPGQQLPTPHVAEEMAGQRHLLVYSSGDASHAYEVASLQGGLFLSTVTAWLKERADADELAVIDNEWVEDITRRMSAAAGSVAASIAQRPWISDPELAFELHRPVPSNPGGSTIAQPAARTPTRPPPAPAPRPAASPRPPARPPPGSQAWARPWFRFQHVTAAWCPDFIALSPALTSTDHGMAFMVDPVTWAQWWSLMGGRPAAMPASIARAPGDNMPVTWVSRADCEHFAARLTAKLAALRPDLGAGPLRLPSDREWTLACACGPATTTGRMPAAGLRVTDAVFRWSAEGRDRQRNPRGPQPVDHAHHHPNAWGLRGMHGNVRELAWHHQRPSYALAMGGGFLSELHELRPDHSIEFHGPGEDTGFRLAYLLQPGEAAILDVDGGSSA